MGTRPEILWPLFGELTTLDGIGPKSAAVLTRSGIEAPRDLALTLPTSVVDRRLRDSVAGAPHPATVTVAVEVIGHSMPSAKGRPARVTVEDAKTTFQLVFFHARSDYLKKILPVGARRIVSGKLELFDGIAQIAHPDHILSEADAAALPRFEPVYPSIGGLAPKVVKRACASAVARAPDLPEWIDRDLRQREGWHDFRSALSDVHAPSGAEAIAAAAPARRRLAYDEVFAHQLTLALARAHARAKPGLPSVGDGALRRPVLETLPYTLTDAQRRAIAEIEADLGAARRMNRLLQGDVGSGKTLVALMALLIAVEAGGQGVLMAPTEVLARQHVAGLQPLVAAAGVRLDLLTGRDKGAERAAKRAALADGTTQIVVGTHAVFQQDVHFHDLRLAVIDEQHRFGVAQRMQLGAKGRRTDVLVMTATPIPRSLSLTRYGDMDVSILDEKPPGRTPVTTAMVSAPQLDAVMARLKAATEGGNRAYWVCPLVEESESSDLTAAEDRARSLRAVFGEDAVGLVHGRLPPAEKDAAMAKFVGGETRVLVATTVIEVGVDVPDASIMVIERAETFGLAQLHQLRGRVGRGTAKSTCLLLYAPPLSESGRRRLELMRETDDGFRIAEEDLAMRGAGDVIGTAQSGLPRFQIADLEREPGLMALAQRDARALLERDPELRSERGAAARILLWLMRQDRAIRLLTVG